MEFDRRSPIYMQIITYFKEQIASGEYSPGSEVPSRRELAEQFKINPNTAQRAYKEMEEQGLIYTEGNSPSKITEDKTLIKDLRMALVDDALVELLSIAKQLNVSVSEITSRIEEKYQEDETND